MRHAAVRIARRHSELIYPPFETLEGELTHGLSWCDFLDEHGTGWTYPLDMEGPLVAAFSAELTFVEAAVRLWPGSVRLLTEREYSNFVRLRCWPEGFLEA